MVYKRVPPSESYDAATGRLIGRAVAAPGTWVYVAVPRPRGVRTLRWLAALGIDVDVKDAGGLTAYERAYQRSLYHVFNGGGNGRRNPRWSIQREWGPVTASGRMLGVRVSDKPVARRAVNRKPRAEQWWRNPELRSGGQGSTQQRFG